MLRPFRDTFPTVSPTAFIADSADVIGRVTIGDDSGIWFGAVLRGDVNQITIGNRSNIQDQSVVHVDRTHPAQIGDDVTIGHGAIVHGCTIGNGSLIGMGAIILDGAVIGENVLVGAGSLVPQGKVIPPRSLVMGSPAKIIRALTEEEVEQLMDSANRYVAYSKEY